MSGLVEYAEDLFLHEAWIRFYGVRLRTRMTLIRLGGGRLFVHSPTPPDAAVRRALEGLGEVAYVVAPNKIHNQALAAWRGEHPRALYFASPGLPERRPGLRFDGVLGDRPRPEWSEELDQAATRGNVFFSEIVFLHRKTRTLVVADLVENLDAQTASRTGRLLARLFGVPARPVASPEHRLYTLDATAAAAALRRVRDWDFERIVLAHGALIERDAREVFGAVCDELLEGARRRRGPGRALLRALAALQ